MAQVWNDGTQHVLEDSSAHRIKMISHTYACRRARHFPETRGDSRAAAVIVAEVHGLTCHARLGAISHAFSVYSLLP